MTDFVYDEAWLRTQTGTHPWGRRALLAVFAHITPPVRVNQRSGVPRSGSEIASYLDVGCGDGYLVDFAYELGIDNAYGVDVAPAPRPGIIVWDLTKPLAIQRGAADERPELFDLVTCWETGEHLADAHADTLVATVANHVGGFLVWTAAIPGQGGDGHINCQPPEYWRRKFEARGLTYDAVLTERLRATWRDVTGPCVWYPQNVQVFRARECQIETSLDFEAPNL